MSTQEVRYVRGINCKSYTELGRSLKVKYFTAFELNVERSCKLFPLSFLLFLRKGYSTTPVIG